jgi:hypothetical protein
MRCPVCGNKMEFEKSDFVTMNTNIVGKGQTMPQTHYRCEECDAEYVRTGRSRLRLIDGRNL